MRTLTFAILMILTVAAASAVELRFEPFNAQIAVDEELTISIMLDESLDIRTAEFTVSYDSLVIGSEDWASGQIFLDTGCMLWAAFEEDLPGCWHGFTVILDAYCHATGPGELFSWTVRGLADGYTRLAVSQARLFDPDGALIEGVSLPDTYVFVGTATGLPEPEPLPASWSDLRALYR